MPTVIIPIIYGAIAIGSLLATTPVPGHASLPKGADPADPKSYEVFKGKDYASDRINEQALAFIRNNKDKPFFLYYPTIIPHVALRSGRRTAALS